MNANQQVFLNDKERNDKNMAKRKKIIPNGSSKDLSNNYSIGNLDLKTNERFSRNVIDCPNRSYIDCSNENREEGFEIWDDYDWGTNLSKMVSILLSRQKNKSSINQN